MREPGRLAFLTERSWIDEDGYHCWTAHDCVNGRVSTMLPWPQWHRVEDQIEPSVNCSDCGAHYFRRVTRTEADFRSNAAHGIYDDPLDPWVKQPAPATSVAPSGPQEGDKG